MSEVFAKFIELMKNIFEMDKSDLDFGIYRIINIQRARIENFLTMELPATVRETLAPIAADTSAVKHRMAEIERQCADLGIGIETSPKLAEEYASLEAQLSQGTDLSDLESEVYRALYRFFDRYYDQGDFLAKRRYKKGVYAIPYEGEEVKLYWVNQDQYYIKTTENLTDYTFLDAGKTIHFLLVDASAERDNNKERDDGKRVFMLYEESEERPEIKTIEAVGNELFIRFVFDVPADRKKKYTEENYQRICDAINSEYKDWRNLLRAAANTDPKKPRTLLEKHLDAYVAKNTFDYFIHKDLGDFLTRELDFYIKNEIVHLEDLDVSNEKSMKAWLAKVTAIKGVGRTMIDFLAQIENFQKKLWLKKKFVVSADWCITLDKIDEAFYAEILDNEAQIREWIDLYAIDEAEGFAEPIPMEFLRRNRNLIVDTRYFKMDFKDRLIASIDHLDAQTNGLLVHSENFQALNTLQTSYAEKIGAVYIDPPFNAASSEILYKNSFKHASWLSLMHDRLGLAKRLLADDGLITVAIDDYEVSKLWELMNHIFGYDNHLGTVCVRTNPKGRMTARKISLVHEYTLVFGKSERAFVKKLPVAPEDKTHNYKQDEKGVWYLPVNLRKQGVDSEAERADGSLAERHYPIYLDPTSGKISVSEQLPVTILPIDSAGNKRIWRRGRDVIEKMYADGELWANEIKGDYQLYFKFYGGLDGKMVQSIWTDAQCSASDYGTKILDGMLGKREVFSYPKAPFAVEQNILAMTSDPDATVLDFFAGSGTTGHAVINLNRRDGGNRRYILAEMGEYFHSVTKSRVKKAVYADKWSDGKPVSRDTGVPQIIKYIRLESYEDALSNISFSEQNGENLLQTRFGDDYLINYMLDREAGDSLLNLEQFQSPFRYQLKINDNNEAKDKTVDLAETFNYLLGLTVARQSAVGHFKAEPDVNGGYEGAVRLASDPKGPYAFKHSEGTLPGGSRALVIWRTVTGDQNASNAALDAYFESHYGDPASRMFDVVYVNGDNNLECLKNDNERWTVHLTEPKFKECMFEEARADGKRK